MRTKKIKSLEDGQKDKGGRPPIEIDMKLLKELASIQCTEAEMCAILGVSQDTFARRKADPEFAQILENGRLHGKVSLRRAHFRLAMTNPAVHIFACKNLLGMTDKPDESGPIPQDQARRIKEALDAMDGAIDGGRDEEA